MALCVSCHYHLFKLMFEILMWLEMSWFDLDMKEIWTVFLFLDRKKASFRCFGSLCSILLFRWMP